MAATTKAPQSLLALPVDILHTLPLYLDNLEDFANLSSTCRALRHCMSRTSPKIILNLAAACSRIFFRPSPSFLVAGIARQLGSWARQSSQNEAALAAAFQHGMEGVLELGLQHCGMTMDRVRELHALRYTTINPAVDLIDKCVGMQWYATPNFWHGGVDDAYTIDTDPPETFFHLVIYGELFAEDFEIFLWERLGEEEGEDRGSRGRQGTRMLSVRTRFEYVKYCIPDWMCYNMQGKNDGELTDEGDVHPLREVSPTGPYAGYADPAQKKWLLPNSGYQVGLHHLLHSKTWKKPWAAARVESGGAYFCGYTSAYGRDWRQLMWEGIVMCQGFESFEGLKPTRPEGWNERLARWRQQIKALKTEPDRIAIGRNFTYRYPFLLGDLKICSSRWPPPRD